MTAENTTSRLNELFAKSFTRTELVDHPEVAGAKLIAAHKLFQTKLAQWQEDYTRTYPNWEQLFVRPNPARPYDTQQIRLQGLCSLMAAQALLALDTPKYASARGMYIPDRAQIAFNRDTFVNGPYQPVPPDHSPQTLHINTLVHLFLKEMPEATDVVGTLTLQCTEPEPLSGKFLPDHYTITLYASQIFSAYTSGTPLLAPPLSNLVPAAQIRMDLHPQKGVGDIEVHLNVRSSARPPGIRIGYRAQNRRPSIDVVQSFRP